ncbi:MAG: SagB/ThcOx family dehydrogenase [Myxococcales bacterium]|nr:SagB/ThcOx family dehydrogenase [Myxococcales bacterium]
MNRLLTSLALAALLLVPSIGLSQDKPAAPPQTIALLPPKLDTGTTLMQAISKRRSQREFDPAPLTQQQLSDVLWVAGGINRPETKGLTIPTAMGSKEIDLYAMLPEGIYAYDPVQHLLTLVNPGDHRAMAGKQPFAGKAPLNLFLVIDEARMRAKEAEAKQIYGAMTAAYASENVYLYCASAELATVVRGAIDVPLLSKLLKLKPTQRLYLGQSVGKALAGK